MGRPSIRASMIFDFMRFFAGSFVHFFRAFSFLLKRFSDFLAKRLASFALRRSQNLHRIWRADLRRLHLGQWSITFSEFKRPPDRGSEAMTNPRSGKAPGRLSCHCLTVSWSAHSQTSSPAAISSLAGFPGGRPPAPFRSRNFASLAISFPTLDLEEALM